MGISFSHCGWIALEQGTHSNLQKASTVAQQITVENSVFRLRFYQAVTVSLPIKDDFTIRLFWFVLNGFYGYSAFFLLTVNKVFVNALQVRNNASMHTPYRYMNDYINDYINAAICHFLPFALKTGVVSFFFCFFLWAHV